jgi:hypothetical protein
MGPLPRPKNHAHEKNNQKSVVHAPISGGGCSHFWNDLSVASNGMENTK